MYGEMYYHVFFARGAYIDTLNYLTLLFLQLIITCIICIYVQSKYLIKVCVIKIKM